MNNVATNSQKYPHLHKSELLQGLPVELRTDFLNQCYVQSFPDPGKVIEQGEPSKGIFLVAHGRVEVSRVNKNGQSTFMGQAVVGRCLGEMEAISEKECIATCIANKDTTLLCLPTKSIRGFLSNPDFVKNLAVVFLDRMEYNNSFRSIDKLDPVDVRLRAYLHFMSTSNPCVEKSQTELAEIICCARQTMNKELGKLRDLGVIELSNGAITVLKRSALVR